jgi:hypothetical protein
MLFTQAVRFQHLDYFVVFYLLKVFVETAYASEVFWGY